MHLFTRTFLLVIIILSGRLYSYGQAPVNDFCINAVDISDGLWAPGNTYRSTLSCEDFRTSNCKSPQQPKDTCCGISGIEGTIWYKFTPTQTMGAYLEYRNQICNPVSYGVTTAIQWFLLKKPYCGGPEFDIVVKCDDPGTVSNLSYGFTAVAGQEYYLQIDTRKNTSIFTTCTCNASSSATCHSSCAFEVRVNYPVPTPIQAFNAEQKNNYINVSWLYNWKDSYEDFIIVRKNLQTKDSVVLVSKSVNDFIHEQGFFSFDDYSLRTNGYYNYSLYGAAKNSKAKFVATETIHVGFAQETNLVIVPNPSHSTVKLLLTNTAGSSYPYTLYNTLGQVVRTTSTEKASSTETFLDIEDLPIGIYHLQVVLEDKIIRQSLIKE